MDSIDCMKHGETRKVRVPDNRFLQPGEPVSWDDVLREPPPEPQKNQPSTKDKFAWMAKKALAKLKNPRADPELAFLPKGANNRINPNKDPFADKIRRALKQQKKSTTFDTISDRPPRPIAIPLISKAPLEPAPARYCPPILASKTFDIGPALDEFGNPLGGEHAVFYETSEDRAKRIEASEKEIAHRKASDRFLALQGRRHINDPLIGRAPPLSFRTLAQQLQRRPSQIKKQRRASVSVKVNSCKSPNTKSTELLPTIPSLEIDRPELNLPQGGDPAFRWDRSLLEKKVPVTVSSIPPEPERPAPPIPCQTSEYNDIYDISDEEVSRQLFKSEVARKNRQLRSKHQGTALDLVSTHHSNFVLKPAKKLLRWDMGVAVTTGSCLEELQNRDSGASQYTDKPLSNDKIISASNNTSIENSEYFADLYREEVVRAHAEVSDNVGFCQEARIIGTYSSLEEGSESPFDDADDDRRRAWDDAHNNLLGLGPDLSDAEIDPEVLHRIFGATVGPESGSIGRPQTPEAEAVETHKYNQQLSIPQFAASSGTGTGHVRSRHLPILQFPQAIPLVDEADHSLHGVTRGSGNFPAQSNQAIRHTSNGRGQGYVLRYKERQEQSFSPTDFTEDSGVPPPVPPKSPYRRIMNEKNAQLQLGARPRERAAALSQVGFRSHVELALPLMRDQATSRTATSPATTASVLPVTTSSSYRSGTSSPRYQHARTATQVQVPTLPLISYLHRPLPLLPPPPQPPPPPPPPPRRPPPPTPPKPSHLKSAKKKSSHSFLDSCLTVSGVRPAKMDNKLQVRPTEFSSVKTKAVEDARQMQAMVMQTVNKAGQDPPKYALLELIGKGSFGRVYKGKDMTSAAIVAVKIIDIDESDTLNPRNANAYSEFLKEVNALKILSESSARNINHVIEALPVGSSMWMITEYCGGGSIATLMKPTAPGGLQEKWIIPILREVAEAIKWVHQAGIIHRDIKCANVLITEEGGVQVCDFGVAGIVEHKLDKRSTIIGTPHWMAPELFSDNPSYGKEVDIWAFGSMVFEIATGLPPNVANGIPYQHLGKHLKHHVPRLEGGDYSNDLRSLVAYCLEELPSSRPTIELVQKHPYIWNTSSRYPASSLSSLVRAFKMWEDHGGSRKSLFMLGGAQGPSQDPSSSTVDDEWNFSTTAAFDQEVSRESTPEDVYEAYGTAVELEGFFSEETSRPTQKASRRRPPPEALARLPAPLEKIFDPNTLSNYEDNSRNHYGRPMPPPTSDLPLRDDSAQTSIRDTMIDLGGHDSDTGLSNFPDMETIKAGRRGGREEIEDEYTSTLHDFSRPALSDPADINPNRRTQDWKFPAMAPPASADSELSRFPASYDIPRPTVTPASGGRPALIHHPTEPVGQPFGGSLLITSQSTSDRLSMRESLIDLDMSLPDIVIPTYDARPSTANSDAGSTTSEQMTSGNPFELERHASLYQLLPAESSEQAEPEFYMTEEPAIPLRLRNNSNPLRDLGEISDFSASDVESSHDTSNEGIDLARYEISSYSDSDIPPPSLPRPAPFSRPANLPYTFSHFPDLPAPPSEKALSGVASHDEMKGEFHKMLGGLMTQLEAFKDVYDSQQMHDMKGPRPQRRERKDGSAATSSS